MLWPRAGTRLRRASDGGRAARLPRRPTLTVLCPTRDPGPRVRTILEPLRAVADEIVVAADAEAGESELGHYAAVADRLLRFERGPRHSALAWLHAQCRGDWVLLLAGDEVVSGELLEALPELTARRDAQQMAFTERWLWPDGRHWLAGAPWYPDFHTRLVRNDGTLRFRGMQHELALPASPRRLVDLPIWHLSLLVSDLPTRREKVLANVRQRPGLLAESGGELNATFYLPEDAPDAVTELVPPGDHERINAALRAAGPPRSLTGIPVAGRAEIEPLWAMREVATQTPPRCTVELLDRTPVRMQQGRVRTIYVRVRNDGPERWPWGADGLPPFRLAFRWVGEGLPPDGRAPLPCDVPVGGEAIVPVHVAPPGQAGSHTLVLDMMLEDVRWFDCGLAVPVEVT